MTDLTEIRQLQDQARLQENLASVGTLSAGIAHEFRNALGTILGYARLLEKHGEENVHRPAREIRKEVDTVRKAVDEFLLYARPPEPAPNQVELEPLIRSVASSAPDNLEVLVDGEYGTVLADEGLLRRVFHNLLLNAAETGSDRRSPVRVRITGRKVAAGRALQVELEDDGPGIDAEDLEKIFVPFHTTRRQGTGLGLALVQRTMVDLGGGVEAANRPGGGAIFRLRFPLTERN
jgi:signal transduction histidine kinase